MPDSLNTLAVAHRFISEHVKPGDFCIDATAGRGHDTAFLCSLVGDTGKVLAFDIQQEAIDSTNQRLSENGFSHIAQTLLESHANMARYAQKESVDCIVFNFGYLPAATTIFLPGLKPVFRGLRLALELLKPRGIMSLCIYYGGDSGFEEKDALMEYLKTIDSKRFTVLVSEFYNRPNCPPIPVAILKEG